jgi:Kef-type K+ transport system membrane component KefB
MRSLAELTLGSGVHPIFGGFIAGLIIPHEGGFAIALVEKIDDLVSMLFLPIVSSSACLRINVVDTPYNSISCFPGSRPILA